MERYEENWIWLPNYKYPLNQKTIHSGFGDHSKGNYTVAEFKKLYKFEKNIASATIIFSADTEFQLFYNGKFLATGPCAVGSDYGLGNDMPRKQFYASKTTIYPESDFIDFFARVRMMPIRLCEYSKGHGGFMLYAEITFDDGEKTKISTDESWIVRFNGAFSYPYKYDAGILPDEYVGAEVIENIWHSEIAPIALRTENEIFPDGERKILLQPNEEKNITLNFNRIHAGFLKVCTKTADNSCNENDKLPPKEIFAKIICRENEWDSGTTEEFIFTKDCEYRGFHLHSVGEMVIWAKNTSNSVCELDISLISCYYPINKVANITTSDCELNRILDLCRHALKYCRQTIHLDSPRHCEPLACTGDYYIESLMTLFSFGDMTLSEFDILRTANLLRDNDGRMFHTTFSLLWVRMLYDVYMITGNIELLKKCKDAILILFKRFKTYIGKNDLIEAPPDFMFVDWIYIDNLSLHHPPKALGQTAMNLFYFGALDAAEKIFFEISDEAMAKECAEKKEKLRKAINEQLFDSEKELYFDGLNTPTPEHLIGEFMPENVSKRYYLKQSNILAVYFGVCDKELGKKIIGKIMSNECDGEYQPYFAHYLFEAIFKHNLQEKYTLKLLERWKNAINKDTKGLPEGFIPPEPTYKFDYSHAWGGTPLYSLPKALLGFKIIKAGLKEIELKPSLLGLKSAIVELPTPYGSVICEMKENEKPKITYPKEVTIKLLN